MLTYIGDALGVRGGTVLFFYYVIALMIVGIDQLTKYGVVKTMSLGESIPVIEGVLHITSHRNRGAAFGILQDARWFFIVVTVVVVAVIVWYMPRVKGQKGMLWSLALILGGAVGNFIDRALHGEVVDFVDLRIINFAIFNVADSAITVGVIIMLLEALFGSSAAKKTDDVEVESER